MKAVETALEGVFLLTPSRFHDTRGWFQESWQASRFSEQIGRRVTFIQDNLSHSSRGVLRGLHMQRGGGQAKLVSVLQGRVFDVVVDARPASSTFGQSFSLMLDADLGQQLWLPEGMAHGFLTISQRALVQYKVNAPYSPRDERVLRFDDPQCAIAWPFDALNSPLIMSEKDQQGLSWAEFCQ